MNSAAAQVSAFKRLKQAAALDLISGQADDQLLVTRSLFSRVMHSLVFYLTVQYVHVMLILIID